MRIFNASEGHSREVYHTKRMQRIFSVHYSAGPQFSDRKLARCDAYVCVEDMWWCWWFGILTPLRSPYHRQ
jgi:hypothetical protein